jgi:predicted transposase YdaD
MKTMDETDLGNSANVPLFLGKSWYKKTMKELNASKISAENDLIYGLAWARIAATAMQDEIDVKKHNEKMKRRDAERDMERKSIAIKKALKLEKLTIKEIAEINDVSIDFVLDVELKFIKT